MRLLDNSAALPQRKKAHAVQLIFGYEHALHLWRDLALPRRHSSWQCTLVSVTVLMKAHDSLPYTLLGDATASGDGAVRLLNDSEVVQGAVAPRQQVVDLLEVERWSLNARYKKLAQWPVTKKNHQDIKSCLHNLSSLRRVPI